MTPNNFQQPRSSPPPPPRPIYQTRKMLYLVGAVALAVSVGVWPEFFGNVGSFILFAVMCWVLWRVYKLIALPLGCLAIILLVCVPLSIVLPGIGLIISAMIICTGVLFIAICSVGSKKG